MANQSNLHICVPYASLSFVVRSMQAVKEIAVVVAHARHRFDQRPLDVFSKPQIGDNRRGVENSIYAQIYTNRERRIVLKNSRLKLKYCFAILLESNAIQYSPLLLIIIILILNIHMYMYIRKLFVLFQ